MKKHTSEEAHYERMRKLANVNEGSTKKSDNRTLGTLISFDRTADGVAYGIIKEQHNYYIKKGGLNEELTVADFAYIGGQQNITEFQYPKLSEAEKQRNMLLKTINEGISTKVSPTGSKTIDKKTILTEDKAGQEIEMATKKVGELDAATDAAEVPVAEPAMEMPAPEGEAEMDAGLDAIPADAPADGGEGMPVADAPVDGGLGDEAPVDGDLPIDGADDGAIDGADGGEEVAVEDPESEATREIEKSLGKLTNTLRKTELTEPQVKSYVNSFLSAFKDDFPEIDIEDRKAMAEKITKVVPPEDIEDLGQNVEDTDGEEEISVAEPEAEIAEERCAECGGFAQYAESRGYNSDTIKECGEEEMSNLVSGYANGHSEGQNDGDFKAIALFITPEIIEKLKSEYGHDDFANQVEPFSTEMNEASAEDKDAQINELFGGLKNLVQQGAQKVKQGAQNIAQKVGDTATAVKQTYHAGEVPAEVKKLEGIAANLGQQIDALNKRMTNAGKEPVNVASILTTIKNQVAGGGAANLAGYANEGEGGIPVDSVEVQPMMEETAIEEDVDIKVSEKEGKKLSPDNVPEVEMKEAEEKEGDVLDIDNLDVSSEESPEGTPAEDIPTPTEETPAEEDAVLDLTKHVEPELEMKSGFESMGGGVVKPDGAETTTVEVTKDSVNITMNESEIKLRKYIRNRLEEHAGIKKPNLTESVKTEAIQKLDRIIEKQFNLFESDVKKKANSVNEVFGFSAAEKFAKLNPEDDVAVENLFGQVFKNILFKWGAIRNVAKNTPTNIKYELLKQYIDNNGGTLRLDNNNNNNLIYQPQSVQNAATKSQFAGGGTQGRTAMGGV